MRAIVKEVFDGVVDGEIHPTSFTAGDVITGDLATTAIKHGQAEEVAEGDAGGPTGYAAMSYNELLKSAAERGVAMPRNTKKVDVIAALEAQDAAAKAAGGGQA